MLLTRAERWAWFNTIMESLTMGENYIEYIQRLVSISIHPNSPLHTSAIPEIIVLLCRGEYVKAITHDAMTDILTVLKTSHDTAINEIRNNPNPSTVLHYNWLQRLSFDFYSWLRTMHGNDSDNDHDDDTMSPYEESEMLLTLFGIATMQLFTQVNYASIPITKPSASQGDMSSAQSMFFHLIDTVQPTAKRTRRKGGGNETHFINVEQNLLVYSTLKLNSEDTYTCAHYPLLLVVFRSIFASSGLIYAIAGKLVAYHEDMAYSRKRHATSSGDGTVRMPSTIVDTSPRRNENDIPICGVFSHVMISCAADVIESSSSSSSSPHGYSKTYFSCPSIVIYALRAVKLHHDLLITVTSSLRSEFFIISSLITSLYGILSSSIDGYVVSSDLHPHQCSSHTQSQTPTTIRNIIDSVVTLHVKSQLIRSQLLQAKQSENHTLATILAVEDVKSDDSFVPNGITDSDYLVLSIDDDSPLLSHGQSSNPHENDNSTTNTTTTTPTSVFVDDIPIIGRSPLTYENVQCHFYPLHSTSFSCSPSSSLQLMAPPRTFQFTYLSLVCIELSHIALKYYLYRRCYLLLSIAKVFSSTCLFVSGKMGRRTKYQLQSYAQLFAKVYTHEAMLALVMKDGVSNDDVSASLGYQIDQVDKKYLISSDLSETIVSNYIVRDTHHGKEDANNDSADIPPESPSVEEETDQPEQTTEEATKTPYKYAINTSIPTEPRTATLRYKNSTTSVCVTSGGYLEDVPLESVDDVYLHYMLPDEENAAVQLYHRHQEQLKAGIATDDASQPVPLPYLEDAPAPLEVTEDEIAASGMGVVDFLATSQKPVIITPKTVGDPSLSQGSDGDGNYGAHSGAGGDSILASVEPSQPPYIPDTMTTISSVLILAVAEYLHTTSPRSDISVQEQLCYVSSLLAHRYTQSTKFKGQQQTSVYDDYSSLLHFTLCTIPFSTITKTLFLRSVLETGDHRLKTRSLTQIEAICNFFVASSAQLRQVHAHPTSIPQLLAIFHNTGINHSVYDSKLESITSIHSLLAVAANRITDTTNNTASALQDQLDITINNLTRFRMHMIYTSNSNPWWDSLRRCGEMCCDAGFTNTALRCYVGVELWNDVIHTLIRIGRRGDAKKVLLRVLRLDDEGNPLPSKLPQQQVDDDGDDTSQPLSSSSPSPSTIITINIPQQQHQQQQQGQPHGHHSDSEEESSDIDNREGSLLTYITRAMSTSSLLHTTAHGTSAGISTHNYRLYHLLGEATQQPKFWITAWELSGESYAPPQRSLAKYYAVRDEYQTAYDCYIKALTLNNIDNQGWYEAGVVAMRLHQYSNAVPCFTRALRIRPDISESWNNLAACHIYLSNISSAFAALEQCLRLRRESWKVWENYLQCAIQLKKYNECITALQMVTTLRGTTDPQTLLPIQYTAKHSKLHVYTLFLCHQAIHDQVTQLYQSVVDAKISPVRGGTPHVLTTLHYRRDPSSWDPITLANGIGIPQFALLDHDSIVPSEVIFPLATTFSEACVSILHGLSSNGAAEASLGGRQRGGGEEAGAANSITAALLLHKDNYQDEQYKVNPSSNTGDDDGDNDDGDNDDAAVDDAADGGDNDDGGDNGDSDNSNEKEGNNHEMELLSSTSSGQQCLVYQVYADTLSLTALTHSELSMANQQYEHEINTLLSLPGWSESPILFRRVLNALRNIQSNARCFSLYATSSPSSPSSPSSSPSTQSNENHTKAQSLYAACKIICSRVIEILTKKSLETHTHRSVLQEYVATCTELLNDVKSQIDALSTISTQSGASSSSSSAAAKPAKDVYDAYLGGDDYYY